MAQLDTGPALTARQIEYREVYLRSDHWQQVRIAALERAEHHCQVCNSAKSLDVHHRTYERVGQERPMDLTVLCRRCHSLFHGNAHLAAPRAARSKRRASSAKRNPRVKPHRATAQQTRRQTEERITTILDSRIPLLLVALSSGPKTPYVLAGATRLSVKDTQVCLEMAREQGLVELVAKKQKRWDLTREALAAQ